MTAPSPTGQARPAAETVPAPNQLQSSKEVGRYARSWFADLRATVFEDGAPFALLAAMSPHEICEAVDLPFVTNEWWTSIVSGKQSSAYYFDWLNEQGFHNGLPSYASLSLASLLAREHPDPPWGGLPVPALMCSVSGESTDRLFGVAARTLDIPYIGLSTPASTRFYPRWWEMSRWEWEDLYESPRIDFMVQQVRTFIAAVEKVTGRRLDIDRLREICELSNRQQEHFGEVRSMICTAPKLPVRLTEVMNNVLIPQWHRGTEWAVGHARQFRDEVGGLVARGSAVCPGERTRLMWVGVGRWQDRGFYSAFEDSHGAVFVRSMYLSVAADSYLKYGLKDPIRALAARYLNLGSQMHMAPWGSEWAVHEAQIHRSDGVVILTPDNQRGAVVGTKLMVQALEEAGIPALELRANAVDGRRQDSADLRVAVADFLERRVQS
jgi:benzoyl-CoA reductase subunit B